jgi:hypothetical protein
MLFYSSARPGGERKLKEALAKLHKAHRLTPAMAAGVSDRLWEIADIVRVLEEYES